MCVIFSPERISLTVTNHKVNARRSAAIKRIDANLPTPRGELFSKDLRFMKPGPSTTLDYVYGPPRSDTERKGLEWRPVLQLAPVYAELFNDFSSEIMYFHGAWKFLGLG